MPAVTIRIPDSAAYRFVMSGKYQPSARALVAAGEAQIARIYQRTLAGLDWRRQPFAPYSTKGPVYWYPRSGAPLGARRASARYYLGKMKGARLAGSGLGLRFPNYAAMKAALGRSGGVVDLFGLGAGPHMLNSMEARVEGRDLVIGIYDDRAALLADVHTHGRGHQPERHWFDISPDELALVAADVAEQMVGSAKGV